MQKVFRNIDIRKTMIILKLILVLGIVLFACSLDYSLAASDRAVLPYVTDPLARIEHAEFERDTITVVIIHNISIAHGSSNMVSRYLRNRLGNVAISGWISATDIRSNQLWNKAYFNQILEVRLNRYDGDDVNIHRTNIINAVNSLANSRVVLFATPIYHSIAVTLGISYE